MGMLFGLQSGIYLAALTALYQLFLLGVVILQYVAMWKIFAKAGEPGWKSLIPLYNGHVLYKLCWKPVYYWLTVILAVPVCILVTVWSAAMMMGEASIGFSTLVWTVYSAYVILALVWSVKQYIYLARAFGYGGAFAIGLVLMPVVFLLILAFGGATYVGNTSRKKTAEEIPTQEPWSVPPVQ